MSKTVRQRGRRNIFTGQVISDKMNKTISVLIYRLVKHPKYKKYIKKTSVFKVHDEKNQAKTGDMVRIFETRALSKTKRWNLIDPAFSGKDVGEDQSRAGSGDENDMGSSDQQEKGLFSGEEKKGDKEKL